MALFVQKYGGTSMGSVERIEHVARKVAGFREQGHQVVVVVSAMSGETDRLLKLAKSISPRGNRREFDKIAATGEQVTIGLLWLAVDRSRVIGITSVRAGVCHYGSIMVDAEKLKNKK